MADSKGWGENIVGRGGREPSSPADAAEAYTGLVQFGLREGDQREAEYSKTMHKAANNLARKLLASDCDSICFIDSGAVFGTDALAELRDDPEGWDYAGVPASTPPPGRR